MTTNTTSGKILIAGKLAPGLAIHGYDAVAYFTQGEPTLGDASHACVHLDGTYRFASKANLEAFKTNPGRHTPQFGGFCAYGVSLGMKLDGDPTKWRIVESKLYLNLDAATQDQWTKDIPGNIEKAETQWLTLAEALQ